MKPVYINKAMIFVLSTGELRRVPEKPIPRCLGKSAKGGIYFSG